LVVAIAEMIIGITGAIAVIFELGEYIKSQRWQSSTRPSSTGQQVSWNRQG
jgi:hypothetical protein